MSFRYLAWAQGAKTGSSTTKAVLLAICSVVNDEGIGWPSQQRIAEDSELSIRTVKSSMMKLEAAGILSRQRRYREGGYRTTDLIQVHQEPQILGAAKSPETLAPEILGATVSNLRCDSCLAEPVIEPVNNNKRGRGRPFPDSFVPDLPTQKVIDLSGCTDNEALDEFDAMRDWSTNAGAKGLKKDWQAFARNWFRKKIREGKSRNGKYRSRPTHGSTLKDAFDEQRSELAARFGEPEPVDKRP